MAKIIEIPSRNGKYRNPKGQRVRLHKVSSNKKIHTRHKVHEGSTIKQFLKENEGYKKS